MLGLNIKSMANVRTVISLDLLEKYYFYGFLMVITIRIKKNSDSETLG